MHQRKPCKPDEEETAVEVDSDRAEETAEAEVSSDSDLDMPLVKSLPGRRSASRLGREAATDLGAQLKGKLQSKLGGPKGLTLLSCQRCGLSFDPKRDGPRCKHCTREDDDESSGDDEDKASGAVRSWHEELYGCPLGGAEPYRLGGLFSFTAGLFAGASPPINAE